jgi:hypothetical protein
VRLDFEGCPAGFDEVEEGGEAGGLAGVVEEWIEVADHGEVDEAAIHGGFEPVKRGWSIVEKGIALRHGPGVVRVAAGDLLELVCGDEGCGCGVSTDGGLHEGSQV